MLGFDFPTFIFQIINFLILLAILARFFYRPVLDVMRQRQEKIDARLEDAEQRAQRAEEERQQLAQQSEAAKREAAALIDLARHDAAKERQRLLQEARADAAEIIEEARKTVATEEEVAINRLGGRLSASAVKIAGSLIRDSSGEVVHKVLLDRLLKDGFGLDADALEQAKLGVERDASHLVLESAYPLEASQEEALQEQAARTLGEPPEKLKPEVRDAPELIAGVRVLLGALVIDMSVRHLLQELSSQEGGGQ
jgi:F-type H+-transporting ATPase subunit b